MAENDEAYSNARFIPGGDLYPARWEAAAAGFRAAAGAGFREVRFGPGEADRFDLFLPAGRPAGLAVFIHGGYWHMFGPRSFSHLAAGAVRRGWACAMPFYPLAPAARIAGITAHVARAMVAMAEAVETGPVAITGHSAGGHLAARMACSGTLEGPLAARIASVVPVSPLSDLGPLVRTTMNGILGIDAAEVMEESPAFLLNDPAIAVHVWVGGAERPAFLDQARWLAEAWDVPLPVEPGRHHFDVIEGLERPDSALMAAVLG
ncbi:MAG: alpha/beta hydrolase [Rhodobacteraceae bacterium]|nr:alpha/beta hydrolase [Paracoccaceae bacterium]